MTVFGDTSQTGNITLDTATLATTAGTYAVVEQSATGAGQIILDDSEGTALNGNGGAISLTAGTDGIVVLSAGNGAADIATTGATVTLNTPGSIGSATNRIRFADNANTAQQNIVVGTTSQPSGVYLDGLGNLTLGTIQGNPATPIDVTVRTNLVVAAGGNVNSGAGTLSLGADLTAAGAGDDGVGTLTISAGATVYGADITLRGSAEDIDPTATVGAGYSVAQTFVAVNQGLDTPAGLAVDQNGNLFVANKGNNTISKVTPGGVVSIFVQGNPAIAAPEGLVFDGSGNLCVVNHANYTISKVTAGGVVSTFAQIPQVAFQPNLIPFLDGNLAIDGQGNLYVAAGNAIFGQIDEKIYKVTPAGGISTFAEFYPQQLPSNTFIAGLAVDSSGNLYAASNTGIIDKIGSNGTFAIWGQVGNFTYTNLNGLSALAFDSKGNLYAASSAGISVIAPGGAAATFVQSNQSPSNLTALAFDPAGNLDFANAGNNTIGKAPFNAPSQVTIRSSLPSRPMSLGGTNNSAVAGINLTNAELARIVTTSHGTITFGDNSQTSNITFTTATPATTAGAATVVVQSGAGQIIVDDGGSASPALNGAGGTVTLTSGTGGIVEKATNVAGTADISNATAVLMTSTGALGTAGQSLQLPGTTLATDTSTGNGNQFLAALGTIHASSLNAGSGTITLSGSGTFQVDGTVASAVTVNGGFVTGDGTMAAVTVNGATLQPGDSPGTLHTGDLLMGASSTFSAQIGGTSPGTGYSQATVTGAVNLGGATLRTSLLNGFVPPTGQSFILIANDGTDPVIGTFANLPEGSPVVVNGQSFRITYVGGDGNDVALLPPPHIVVTGLGGNTVTAGNPFLITVQAADQFGNRLNNFNGQVTFITTDPQVATLPTVTLTNGFGVTLGALKTVAGGPWTITATSGSLMGTSNRITVISTNPVYFKVTAPQTSVANTSFPITVTALDAFGNVATNYAGTVGLSSTDGAANAVGDLGGNYTFTTGPGQDNGMHVFNVQLLTEGNQKITVADTTATVPAIIGTSSNIAASGLTVTALTKTPTGFTATFNQAINPADLTLYGKGNTQQDVLLIGTNTNLGQPYPGTLIVDPSKKLITFNISSNFLVASNPNGSAALPDDTYTVTLLSGVGNNGFQDVSGQGLDDGQGGHADFVGNFTTTYQHDNTEVLGIPDFARGPNASGDTSTLVKVPNDPANGGHIGIPITIYNASNLTSAGFSLAYNANILTVTGGDSDPSNAAASFQMTSNVMSGDGVHSVATFAFSDTAILSGTQILGDIAAYVPYAARSQYQVKDLLALGNITVNSGATVVPGNAVDVDAYFGDVNGDHHIDGVDKGLIANVASTLNTGFTAFTLLDPAIIGDVSGDNAVTANSTSLLSNYLLALHVAKIPALPDPAIADNLFTSPFASDPTLSLPASVQPNTDGVVNVRVLLDHPRPAGSTGLVEAELALAYDSTVLSVSAADITLGSIPRQGTGWQLSAVVNSTTGMISIQLYSQTSITTDQAGSLVNIAFHVKSGGNAEGTTTVQLLGAGTVLADEQAAMILSPGLDWTAVLTSDWVQSLNRG